MLRMHAQEASQNLTKKKLEDCQSIIYVIMNIRNLNSFNERFEDCRRFQCALKNQMRHRRIRRVSTNTCTHTNFKLWKHLKRTKQNLKNQCKFMCEIPQPLSGQQGFSWLPSAA